MQTPQGSGSPYVLVGCHSPDVLWDCQAMEVLYLFWERFEVAQV